MNKSFKLINIKIKNSYESANILIYKILISKFEAMTMAEKGYNAYKMAQQQFDKIADMLNLEKLHMSGRTVDFAGRLLPYRRMLVSGRHTNLVGFPHITRHVSLFGGRVEVILSIRIRQWKTPERG